MAVKLAVSRLVTLLAVTSVLLCSCARPDAQNADLHATESSAAAGLGPATPQSPQLEGFHLSTKILDVADEGAGLEIHFDLSRPSDLWLDILDEAGRPLRTESLGRHAAGPIVAEWDGRDAAGAVVTPGVYLYRVRARSVDGHDSVYGREPIEGGVEVFAQRFSYPRGAAAMQFVLPEPSRVRLRVGLRSLPHLLTVYDWEPLEAGRHVVPWNGLDASGEIRLAAHPDVRFMLSAFSLPRNSVIVRRGDEPVSRGPIGAARADAEYRHAQHRAEVCHDVRFAVDFPGARGRSEDGTPILGRDPKLRVTVDEADAAYLLAQPYEIMLYVDTIFLAEDEEGVSPFSYELPAQTLSPGRHLLTVNIATYDGHGGVVSVPFVVGSDAPAESAVSQRAVTTRGMD